MTKIITLRTPSLKEKLRELHKDIWESKILQQRFGDRWRSITTYGESRSLTTTEWKYIKRCAKSLELPVVMTNSAYGFGVAIQIYDTPECPAVCPELLMAVSQKHFEEKFNAGWDRFYPLITEKRNLELINFCGLPKLLEKSYYEY